MCVVPEIHEEKARVCSLFPHRSPFADFVVFHRDAEGTIATLALWVILTYGYPAFDAVPYLMLTGPYDSGKSRVMDLLERMGFRPFADDNPSAATIFRRLHANGGTLLFDEAERLKDPKHSETWPALLAGYRKGASVNR